MPKYFLLLLALGSGLVSFPAQAQTPAVTVAAGEYRGDVDAKNGDFAFLVKIDQVEGNTLSGTSHFYKATSICRRPFPMTGVITHEGRILLDASKALDVPGCGRTFDLKVSGAGFEGVLNGPQGRFNVTLTPR